MPFVRLNVEENGLPRILADLRIGDALCFLEGDTAGFKGPRFKQLIARATSLPAFCEKAGIDLKQNYLRGGIVHRIELTSKSGLHRDEIGYVIWLGTDHPANLEEQNVTKFQSTPYDADSDDIALYQIFNNR